MRTSCSRPGHRYNPPALRRLPLLTRRLRAAQTLLWALAAALVAPSGAVASWIAPQDGSGSPNAVKIKTLYLITFIVGMIIFFVVEGLLIYALVKFRRRRGGPAPVQIRGNTPLEIGWTLGAAGVLVALTVVTFIFLGGIINPAASRSNGYVAEAQQSGMKFADAGDSTGTSARNGVEFASLNQSSPPGPASKHLEIHVNGQQYLWRFDYPGKQQVFSYHDLIVPVNTTVVLNITASDVDHSWWVPDLGGKADAIPGHVNHTWFQIRKPGTYQGNCAEFCGENHADMTAHVIAVTPDQYRAFLTKQASDLKQSQALLALARTTRGNGTGTP